MTSRPAPARPPPHSDVGAERAVIGAVFINPDLLDQLIPVLGEGDFAIAAHVAIWEGFLALRDLGDPCDAITLRTHLKAKGTLAVSGDAGYFAKLEGDCSTTSNVLTYAKIIKQLSARRRFIELAQSLKGDADNLGLDPATAALTATKILEQIATGSACTSRGLKLVCGADVVSERIDWLWDQYLPRGKIAILEGDPGTGKTTIAASLISCLTRGTRLPCGGESGEEPCDAVISSLEDGIADTLAPRLRAASADMRRVHFVDVNSPTSLPVTFPRDVSALENAVIAKKAKLVVIDTLMAHFDSRLDSYKDQDARTALTPLAAMAARTGCTILAIRHLNKASGASAIYRGGGSVGFTGAARIVLLAAKDPSSTGNFVLAGVKSNLGAPPPSLSYSILQRENASVIGWGGVSALTADQLLAQRDPHENDAMSEAQEFLRTQLREGARLATDMERLFREECIAKKTIERAKKSIGVKSVKPGWAGNRWYWCLPADLAVLMTPPDKRPDAATGAPQPPPNEADPFGDQGQLFEPQVEIAKPVEVAKHGRDRQTHGDLPRARAIRAEEMAISTLPTCSSSSNHLIIQEKKNEIEIANAMAISTENFEIAMDGDVPVITRGENRDRHMAPMPPARTPARSNGHAEDCEPVVLAPATDDDQDRGNGGQDGNGGRS